MEIKPSFFLSNKCENSVEKKSDIFDLDINCIELKIKQAAPPQTVFTCQSCLCSHPCSRQC